MLVLVDVDVELLVELTVDVEVDVLLVSTSVFESYTVCADTLKAAPIASAARVFLNIAPVLLVFIVQRPPGSPDYVFTNRTEKFSGLILLRAFWL